MEAGILKFTWEIKDFSNLESKKLISDVFSVGPYKWRISAYPKGNKSDQHLSIFLVVVDPEASPSGRNAKFSFTLINQIDKKMSFTRDAEHEFGTEHDWGFSSFISHAELHDPKNGYLVEDTCIIEAHVTNYAGKQTSKEDSLKNTTEEDMDAFFGDLNSVSFPKKIVSSEEEAKQALEIIHEAINMVPSDMNDPSRMSQLKTAFDVLSLLDDCSLLASEQKAELLSMKNNFFDLPEQAARAVKDIELFNQKELLKKNLDWKLSRCLTEFEKAKAETKQNEQNLVILQERVDSLLAQIGETKKKKDNSLLKQKELFKLSKEFKDELDVLVVDLPEYETKMKDAEEVQKKVGTEWNKMKQLVPSLNL